MAKKKNLAQGEELIAPEAVEVHTQTEEIHEGEELIAPTSEPAESETKQDETVPDKLLAFFERHRDIKSLYMDKLGGLFHTDTPAVFVKGAVLYHNPYFNK